MLLAFIEGVIEFPKVFTCNISVFLWKREEHKEIICWSKNDNICCGCKFLKVIWDKYVKEFVLKKTWWTFVSKIKLFYFYISYFPDILWTISFFKFKKCSLRPSFCVGTNRKLIGLMKSRLPGNYRVIKIQKIQTQLKSSQWFKNEVH